MWSVGETGRVWTGRGMTVIDDGAWTVIFHEAGHRGLATSYSVKYKDLDGLLNYLKEEDLRDLGWTPLVILSLCAGSDYDLPKRPESSS